VDVQIAEERLPQRIAVRAIRALLGAREAEAERGSEDERERG
jgi:hypothetical protein